MSVLTEDARRALEEAAARAWPPHETLERDGWTLRFSGGGSQRANSVQSLYWSGTDTEAASLSSWLAERVGTRGIVEEPRAMAG